MCACFKKYRRLETIEEMFEAANLHANGNIQNMGLPLIKISKIEIYLYMQTFHERIESCQNLSNLDPDFATMACSALYIFWKDYQLVEMTLVNIRKVAKIATDDVKVELREKKVILAASLAICFLGQKGDNNLLTTFDDCIGFAMCIFYYCPTQKPGQPLLFHHRIISAIIMIVPYLVDHLERDASNIEQFAWILKQLLVTFKFCFKSSKADKPTMIMAINWLIKHGVVGYVFKYIKNYQFGVSENLDANFMRMIDIAYLLREDAQSSESRSIVPKMFKLMDITTFSTIRTLDIKHFRPVGVIMEILKYIIENSTTYTHKYLLTCNFIRNMLNAIDFHRDQRESISVTLLRAIDKFKDGMNSEKKFKMYLLLVKDLFAYTERFIIPSNDLKFVYSQIVCYAADQLVIKDSITRTLENGSFVLMMKAFTISCCGNNCENGDASFRSTFGMSLIDVINEITYEDKHNTLYSIRTFVCDHLPNIVNQYSYGERNSVPTDSTYCHAITLLVLHSLGSIEDFNSIRWKSIHNLMIVYCVHSFDEKSFREPTSLILTWKIISFNLRDLFIPSLKQIEIELGKCDNLDIKTLSSIKSLKDLVLSSDLERCFRHLVKELNSSLDGDCGETLISIFRLRRITRLMYKIAQNNKMKCQLKLLRGLVFNVLDVVKDCKDSEVEENVNKFVIHLFLNIMK